MPPSRPEMGTLCILHAPLRHRTGSRDGHQNDFVGRRSELAAWRTALVSYKQFNYCRSQARQRSTLPVPRRQLPAAHLTVQICFNDAFATYVEHALQQDIYQRTPS